MLPVVITGLALAKKRRMKEIIPLRLVDVYEEWELRILVSLSLAIQVVLILLGSQRKKVAHPWIRIVVWTAYLSADAAAIYALGITPGELPQMEVKGGSTDPTAELKAFWAPFLLIHLGGQDTITANSLEDNELWLRHWLSLFSQTVATLYVFILSWNGSHLSLLYAVILICGLLKYGERVVILWAASSEQFRDSTPVRQEKISQIAEEQNLKEAEGHVVVPHQVIELHQVGDREENDIFTRKTDDLTHEDRCKRSQGEILIARRLVDIFRPAFTDMLLSKDDRESSKSTLKGMHFDPVFNIMSIELGFIYDLLFTKAMVFKKWWGLASRIVILSLIGLVLVVFAVFDNNASHNKIDRYITFALLGVAFVLELSSLLVHLLSDKVTSWLLEHNKFLFILKFSNWLQPFSKRQRWSNKMGQFCLLSYSLKEKHLCRCCHKMLGLLCIDEKVEKLFYNHRRNVSDELKKDVLKYIGGMISTINKDLASFRANKDNWHTISMPEELHESLIWSFKLDFDMCILVWHIATHICKQRERLIGGSDSAARGRVSMDLSRYMLFLLVRYPFMLPAGIGRIKFHDMHATVTAFLEEHQSSLNEMLPEDLLLSLKVLYFRVTGQREHENLLQLLKSVQAKVTDFLKPQTRPKGMLLEDLSQLLKVMHSTITALGEHQTSQNGMLLEDLLQQLVELLKEILPIPVVEQSPKQKCCPKKPKSKKAEACRLMVKQVKTQLNLRASAGDKSKLVLFYSCKLASQLRKIDGYYHRWTFIEETWIAMLILAALNCKASYHLQHLTHGGELLTHVWLLLVHYGFTDHFQLPHAPEVAELLYVQ